jgi:hypothetical protein
MTETKQFHIGDILSIIDGHLVSPTKMDGVYAILGWMTDSEDGLWTHQLLRAAEDAKPVLIKAFPDLAAIQAPDFESPDDVMPWLEGQVSIYGEYRDVPRVAEGVFARIDPLLELQNMVGADRVIPVVIGDDDPIS